MPAGYSGTPLAKKLGIRPGARLCVLGAPEGYLEALALPDDVEVKTSLRGSRPFDVIHFFTTSERELARRFPVLAERLTPAGGLWISWPKRSSGVPSEVGDAEVRRIGLQGKLVDNKVCAVDETWSGLRFVLRREHR